MSKRTYFTEKRKERGIKKGKENEKKFERLN